eukprot:TRINITY_DN7850_c0_g2_i3.p1 TRINITY_DN7850_c0_g2~~TRINITY_DN7850_c0_g2_i3.p1  ORF type:complete len:346 (+),score=34.73 TRINITY_DN7850_c0_g2_i3:304-1341(+)
MVGTKEVLQFFQTIFSRYVRSIKVIEIQTFYSLSVGAKRLAEDKPENMPLLKRRRFDGPSPFTCASSTSQALIWNDDPTSYIVQTNESKCSQVSRTSICTPEVSITTGPHPVETLLSFVPPPALQMQLSGCYTSYVVHQTPAPPLLSATPALNPTLVSTTLPFPTTPISTPQRTQLTIPQSTRTSIPIPPLTSTLIPTSSSIPVILTPSPVLSSFCQDSAAELQRNFLPQKNQMCEPSQSNEILEQNNDQIVNQIPSPALECNQPNSVSHNRLPHLSSPSRPIKKHSQFPIFLEKQKHVDVSLLYDSCSRERDRDVIRDDSENCTLPSIKYLLSVGLDCGSGLSN